MGSHTHIYMQTLTNYISKNPFTYIMLVESNGFNQKIINNNLI